MDILTNVKLFFFLKASLKRNIQKIDIDLASYLVICLLTLPRLALAEDRTHSDRGELD